MSKYLLCIPHAGWNDQLSIIYKCYIYCYYTNRILLLYNNCLNEDEDFDHPNLNCIYNFDLTKYINIKLNNIITDKNTIEKIIESIPDNEILRYIPHYYDNELPKRLNRYFYHKDEIKDNINYDNIMENNNNILNYNHTDITLVCFYDCGGLIFNDTNFLSCFVFRNNIKEQYNHRLELLPKEYVSFHIRNTDRKCDYKEIIEQNKQYLLEPIYLATDSIEVYNYVKSIAKNKVYHFSTLNLDNKPIHHYHKNIISKEQRLIELILDLLCVANSKIYISSVGGFSTLCKTYFDNRTLIQFE